MQEEEKKEERGIIRIRCLLQKKTALNCELRMRMKKRNRGLTLLTAVVYIVIFLGFSTSFVLQLTSGWKAPLVPLPNRLFATASSLGGVLLR